MSINRRGFSVLVLFSILVAAVCCFNMVYKRSKIEKIEIIDALIEENVNSGSASELMLPSDVDCEDINSVMEDVYSQRAGQFTGRMIFLVSELEKLEIQFGLDATLMDLENIQPFSMWAFLDLMAAGNRLIKYMFLINNDF